MSIKDRLKEIVFTKHQFNQAFWGPYKGISFYHGPQMYKRTVVYYKAWEKHVTQWMKELVDEGNSVMIIGAHVGIHALYTAKLVGPKGSVIAFEPWQENYDLLEKNKQKNAFSQLRLEQMAVADTEGIVNMQAGASDGTHHLSVGDNAKQGTTEVKSTTIDRYCTMNNINPKLLLVDVEGFEELVLRGAEKLITTQRPILILEHHDVEMPGSKAKVLAILKKHGYKVEEVERHLLARP